jgi:hypothetical protein
MKSFIAALAAAFVMVVPVPALAGQVTPPPVPDAIKVETGNVPYLVGHAIGTQNYICLPAASGAAFKLFTPQATLFDEKGKQITTHFFSPNPDEHSTIRATWQDSEDSSTVWGEVKPGASSSDANFVATGAIPWLLVTAVGKQDGRNGHDTLSQATFIQRVNTAGGIAPSTGCASSADIGMQAFVPYTADYFFFRKADNK